MKFKVNETEQIHTLSALLQDGLFSLMLMYHDKASQQFHMLINRFCWELVDSTANDTYYRTHCGLYISGTEKITTNKKIRFSQYADTLPLLHLNWSDNTKKLSLIFSGDIEMDLVCSNLNIYLADTHEPWPSNAAPSH